MPTKRTELHLNVFQRNPPFFQSINLFYKAAKKGNTKGDRVKKMRE